MKAFYYWGDYFLLPERYASLEDFRNSPEIKGEVTLSKLNEKGCMAPYFMTDGITQESVVIHTPEAIYPAKVTLMSREEYAKKLAFAAEEYCKGCARYQGDGNLLGDELTLDGMCYEDEENFRDQLRDKVLDFWAEFGKNRKGYEEAADREDASVGAEIQKGLDFLPGVYVSVRKLKDQYHLMISGLFDQYLSLLCSYVVEMAPEDWKDSWKFYSYLPQNIYRYIPTNEEVSVYKNAPLIRFTKRKADRPRFDVTLKIAPHEGSEVDIFRENMLYVFSVLGENRFYAALSSLNCDTEYDKKAEGFVHLKDYSVAIQKEYMDALRVYFRRFHYGEFPLKREQASGRRRDDQLVTTNWDRVTHALLSGKEEGLNGLIPYADVIGTLTFDFGCSIKEYSPKLRAVHDQIEDALYSPGHIIPFATCYGTTKVYVDFILADVNKARKAIRALTPLFEYFGAVYTETSASGSNSYRADYELGIHEA